MSHHNYAKKYRADVQDTVVPVVPEIPVVPVVHDINEANISRLARSAYRDRGHDWSVATHYFYFYFSPNSFKQLCIMK